MCGRFVSPDDAAMERAWHLARHNNNPFARRFNVAPTATVPVLRHASKSGELEVCAARWGLVPHWWTDAKMPRFTFNARVEEARAKPMWRDALRLARCVVPAEGWYEWQESASIAPVAARKQPLFIHRCDSELFAFAGLMAQWKPPDGGEPLVSCAVLTTSAAGHMTDVHTRMPVVLSSDAQTAWLNRELEDGNEALKIPSASSAPDELEYYPVSTLVNNARAESEELIRRLEHTTHDVAGELF